VILLLHSAPILQIQKNSGGHESLASIAASVGYESETAFSRAFKRITGMTPGSWRDGTGLPATSN
jgi:AraC family transcriptional regulator, alkane utilization regulator